MFVGYGDKKGVRRGGDEKCLSRNAFPSISKPGGCFAMRAEGH